MWFRPLLGLSTLQRMARDESGSQHTGGSISIVGLRKEFEGVTAVDGIDLEIEAGEFFTLLGPSGCGKTTTLRMLAGFEQPTDGQIFIDGVDVAQTPAHKRPVNTVFQSYALFPHLDVEQNVAYGLRWRKDLDKKLRASQVAKALDLVQLGGYGKRRPHQLSGGQQQRAALARALAPRPAIVLLDEPFNALDLDLRRIVCADVVAALRLTGATALLVTHDPAEAFANADFVAAMRRGEIAQFGDPKTLYDRPVDADVARLTGPTVFLDAVVEQGWAQTALGSVAVEPSRPGPAQVMLRPEQLKLCTDGSGFYGTVVGTTFFGDHVRLEVQGQAVAFPG